LSCKPRKQAERPDRDALRRAGAEYEAIGNTKGRMKLAIQLGILEVRCGNFAAAREHLESARAWFQEHDMLAMVTESLGVLAMAVDGDGKLDEAVQMNRAAMQLARSGGNRNCAATLLGNIGDLLQRQGKLVEALAAQDAALAEKLALGDRDGGSVTLQNIARLHLDLHHDELAMTAAQQSLELAGQTMHGLGEGALELENKSRQAADFGLIAAALLQHDGKIDMAAGVARCLWFAEVGRAARLREMLANRRDLLANRVGEDLVAAEETARAAVDRARMHLLALERGDGKADAFAAARVELDEANRGLEAAALAIARASRRAGWIARTEPVTLAQLQQHLRPDTALVLYQIVPGQKVFAILVRADRARIEPLGDTESLTAAIARYQLLLATDGSDELPAAKAMHKQLLGPFAADLTGVTRLVVVPDSSLAFLPFEALVDASGKRLVDRFEITYAPSATVLALLQDGTSTAPGNHLLALGDPVYPSERDPGSSRPTPRDAVLRGTAKLERLVATGDEVRAIAALFAPDRQQVLVREQATRRQLLAALEQQKAPLLALHLACHGHLDERRPLLSGLVLGDGELLSVSDVHRLQLDADLVVLSACDSGRGAIARGEGVLGLTRSFLFAGAARVVVADWQVADTNSRELMVQFYRHMLQEHLRPSQALREAKRALLETPAHSHPYHWAGFVLWGAMD